MLASAAVNRRSLRTRRRSSRLGLLNPAPSSVPASSPDCARLGPIHTVVKDPSALKCAGIATEHEDDEPAKSEIDGASGDPPTKDAEAIAPPPSPKSEDDSDCASDSSGTANEEEVDPVRPEDIALPPSRPSSPICLPEPSEPCGEEEGSIRSDSSIGDSDDTGPEKAPSVEIAATESAPATTPELSTKAETLYVGSEDHTCTIHPDDTEPEKQSIDKATATGPPSVVAPEPKHKADSFDDSKTQQDQVIDPIPIDDQDSHQPPSIPPENETHSFLLEQLANMSDDEIQFLNAPPDVFFKPGPPVNSKQRLIAEKAELQDELDRMRALLAEAEDKLSEFSNVEKQRNFDVVRMGALRHTDPDAVFEAFQEACAMRDSALHEKNEALLARDASVAAREAALNGLSNETKARRDAERAAAAARDEAMGSQATIDMLIDENSGHIQTIDGLRQSLETAKTAPAAGSQAELEGLRREHTRLTAQASAVCDLLDCPICLERFQAPLPPSANDLLYAGYYDVFAAPRPRRRVPKALGCGHVYCCLPEGSPCPMRCDNATEGNLQRKVWPNRLLMGILEAVEGQEAQGQAAGRAEEGVV